MWYYLYYIEKGNTSLVSTAYCSLDIPALLEFVKVTVLSEVSFACPARLRLETAAKPDFSRPQSLFSNGYIAHVLVLNMLNVLFRQKQFGSRQDQHLYTRDQKSRSRLHTHTHTRTHARSYT